VREVGESEREREREREKETNRRLALQRALTKWKEAETRLQPLVPF